MRDQYHTEVGLMTFVFFFHEVYFFYFLFRFHYEIFSFRLDPLQDHVSSPIAQAFRYTNITVFGAPCCYPRRYFPQEVTEQSRM